jgi:glycosyltransferase involved in cell wall biosynthesis
METACPNVDYEHLVVDNSSTDGTAAILEALAKHDRRLKVAVNNRNIGASRSMFEGIRLSTKQACIPFLPADLQDPPDLIPQMIEKWEEGYDRVYGVRQNRKESRLLRRLRSVYYQLLSRMSDAEIPSGAGEFQLLDSSIVEQLAEVDDYYPFVRGLIAMTGVEGVAVPYNWEVRTAGKSHANLRHLLDLGVNGILATSRIPARLIFLLGIAIAVPSFVYALGSLILALFVGSTAAPGVSTLVVAIFFFSGIQLICISIVGEYVTAIHSQLRRGPRPYFKKKINFEG